MRKKGVNVTVIGCGAWATTAAIILADNNHYVRIWCHRDSIVDEINKTRKRSLLPNVTLSSLITATADEKDAINKSEAIIFCVASPYVLETLQRFKTYINPEIPVLSLTKGIISSNNLFLSTVLKKEWKTSAYAILSGPNLALEIAQKKPAASVVASQSNQCRKYFQELLSNHYFRVYTSSDEKGIMLAGILKNIIAIAAGCCDALECGTNAKATLVTRGLQEIIRFSVKNGAQERTLYGLAGCGDLIATCDSSKSRNYKMGYALGKGKKYKEMIVKMGAVTEGINTCKQVMKISKEQNLLMPITESVYNIVFKEHNPEECIKQLMRRKLTSE